MKGKSAVVLDCAYKVGEIRTVTESNKPTRRKENEITDESKDDRGKSTTKKSRRGGNFLSSPKSEWILRSPSLKTLFAES